MSLVGLLGDEVLNTGDHAKVSVASLEKEGSVIGLYFSAHWCPPCRAFTPQLAEWYKKFKKGPNGDKFDIVFVSSDRDEKSWKEYFAEMPWKALDFSDRDKKGELSKKFKVQGIPTLIFVDGKTGSLITGDGRSIIGDDKEGAQFPWKPKPFSEMISSGKFVNKDKGETTWEELKGKVIGLYFSAHWCGPCRSFTPQFVKTYEKLKEDGKPFEVIFVSSDRDEESWQEYLSTMPWYSIPFGDDRKKALSRKFDVSGIPTLIIVDDKGDTITKNGRSSINLDPEGKDFPWYPKPVMELNESTAGELNDTASLIWFVPDDSVEKTVKLLEPLAKNYIAKWTKEKTDPEMLFYVSGPGTDGGDEIRESLRSFAKLKSDDLLLAIIDIPEQKVYEAETGDITEENVTTFVTKYFDGTLQSRPLRA